jgi:hypothetical protein
MSNTWIGRHVKVGCMVQLILQLDEGKMEYIEQTNMMQFLLNLWFLLQNIRKFFTTLRLVDMTQVPMELDDVASNSRTSCTCLLLRPISMWPSRMESLLSCVSKTEVNTEIEKNTITQNINLVFCLLAALIEYSLGICGVLKNKADEMEF